MSERTGALEVLAGQEDNKRSFHQFRPKLFPYLAERGAYAKNQFRLWVFLRDLKLTSITNLSDKLSSHLT